MSAPKPPPDSVLARAAELRAAGASWEAVAAAVRRSADAARQWPARYPDRWQAALRAAEQKRACETTAEAVIVLRRLLRSEDDKVARDAARALIDLRIELARLDRPAGPADTPPPPSLPSDAQQLVSFLEGHTDEELARLASQLYPPPPLPPVEDEPPAVAGSV